MFFWLWTAGVAGNIGIWSREVGLGWAMTEMSRSAVIVSLVSAAGTLPLFALAVPAGAMADVMNRRWILLGSQIAMVVLSGLLAVLTLSGLLTPMLLLACSLGLGAAAALANPAWQSVMTDLVPREELPAASALNSISLNLSRAVGPAIGGLLVAQFGAWATFALSAVLLVGIVVVLAGWRYTPARSAMPRERFAGALKAGARYVRHSPTVHGVLVRTALFTLPASVLWGLMPLVARDHLHLQAWGFGVLMTCLGAGAVVCAWWVLPRLRTRLSPTALVVAGSLLYSAALVVIALSPLTAVTMVAVAMAGAGWITNVTCLNVAAQTGAPAWVRARVLASYLAVFFGGMALGSPLWGFVASREGIPAALLIAAGVLAAGLLSVGRFRLHNVAGEDLDHSDHWDALKAIDGVHPDDGPVVVTIEYRIAEEDAAAFVSAMEPVRTTRYRDGAFSWVLSRDTADPTRWLEVFMVESWAEHERQHHRVTQADRRVQDVVRALHRGLTPGHPTVSHWISQDVDSAAGVRVQNGRASTPHEHPPGV